MELSPRQSVLSIFLDAEKYPRNKQPECVKSSAGQKRRGRASSALLSFLLS
jgi:hypothetical protein